MSLLEPIIEHRMQDRGAMGPHSLSDAISRCSPEQDLRDSALGCHASWYIENLEQCSEPMLQYESAWIHGRIHALEHCRSHADSGGHAAIVGANQQLLSEMLIEARLFLKLLLREFAARGLHPEPPRADVIPSEEAWEITSQKVKEEWGIV